MMVSHIDNLLKIKLKYILNTWKDGTIGLGQEAIQRQSNFWETLLVITTSKVSLSCNKLELIPSLSSSLNEVSFSVIIHLRHTCFSLLPEWGIIKLHSRVNNGNEYRLNKEIKDVWLPVRVYWLEVVGYSFQWRSRGLYGYSRFGLNECLRGT